MEFSIVNYWEKNYRKKINIVIFQLRGEPKTLNFLYYNHINAEDVCNWAFQQTTLASDLMMHSRQQTTAMPQQQRKQHATQQTCSARGSHTVGRSVWVYWSEINQYHDRTCIMIMATRRASQLAHVAYIDWPSVCQESSWHENSWTPCAELTWRVQMNQCPVYVFDQTHREQHCSVIQRHRHPCHMHHQQTVTTSRIHLPFWCHVKYLSTKLWPKSFLQCTIVHCKNDFLSSSSSSLSSSWNRPIETIAWTLLA